jgi:rhamnosyl/mannosyltransferase
MVKTKKFNLLHISKYSFPSKGGIENYVDSLLINNSMFKSTVISNSRDSKSTTFINNGVKYIKLKTWFYVKSQPISFGMKILRKELKGSNLVHLHFPYPTMEMLIFLLKPVIKKSKFVVTYHANPQKTRWKSFSFFYSFLNNFIFKLADRIIITSKKNLISSNIPEKYWYKTVVLPIGIKLDKEEFYLEPKKFPKNKMRLLFVGQLRKYKGVQILIEAVQDIDVELNIIGNGEMYDSLVSLINKLNLKNRVFIHRNVDDESLQKYYLNSDLFILPSIDESESFGIVQLEALKYRLPIINTNLASGVTDVSINDFTGLTVSPNSVGHLSSAINIILKNPLKYENFSSNTEKHVLKFDDQEIKEQYVQILQDCLNDIFPHL